MMIAALHLRAGDLPVYPLPPSDEDGFDIQYRTIVARGERVLYEAGRNHSSDPNRTRRVITFGGYGYRCWNNETLIEVQERAS